MKNSGDYFNEDLIVGEAIEMEVLKKIQKKYPNAYKKLGYCKEYDLVIPEINKTVEVKQDFKAKHTNNIVIETDFGGVPSALSVTKADYWAITDGYWLYWITPDNIRKCIADYEYVPSNWIGPGDTKMKTVYLMSRYDLLGYCIQPIIKLEESDPLHRDNFITRKLKDQ